ncbi:unnamed protein product [Durusdinium trenchii]|uniref:Calmodulin n=2 Tax=Durusdinium trenchii TaxID=1381693 RepID=A0ABP0SZJ7_9DINO
MVDHVVLNAFKRFDQDGSGCISREELGTVLQSLNPDDWDSERIDELLAEADSSGDGKLQIQEFLKWIFAEDPKSVGLGLGVVGDFSYVISGCSRADINGVYVQQGKFCSHRPVFFCAANKYFLFYWKAREQWQIHKRPAGKSCARLKTSGAPHLEAGWQVWKKKERSLRCAFLPEPEMTCSLPPALSVEEQIAKAPKAMFVKEYGTFLKDSKELFGGRPLYYNEVFKMWMMYVEKFLYWKLSYDKDDDAGTEISGKTKGYSPDLATWSKDGLMMDVFAFDPDATLNAQVPEGWKDPDFPHSSESLGQRFADEECEWVRALALSSSPVLFNKAEPTDACQGQLGDTWLIAAIAAVAEYPNYLKEKIFITKEAAADGKYELQLFDWKSTKTWKTIQVDDYLPCVPRKGKAPFQHTMFADLSDGEMYVPLLEKAFAKLFGSYQELHYGTTPMAFAALTGCTMVQRFGAYLENVRALTKSSGGKSLWQVTGRGGLTVRAQCDPKSTKIGTLARKAVFEELDRNCYRIMFKKIEGEGAESGWINYYTAGEKVAERSTNIQWGSIVHSVGDSFKKEDIKLLESDMWIKLMEADKSNSLIVVNFEFRGANPQGRPLYGTRPDGLMPRHAYTVLQAVEIPGEVWEDPTRMVCLRNPWGRCEWKGPWKDEGEEWKKNPKLAVELKSGKKTDGVFWMAWDDFEWCADTLTIVPTEIPVKRGQHEDGEDAGED